MEYSTQGLELRFPQSQRRLAVRVKEIGQRATCHSFLRPWRYWAPGKHTPGALGASQPHVLTQAGGTSASEQAQIGKCMGQLPQSLPGPTHAYTKPDRVHTAKGLGILASPDPVQAGALTEGVQTGNFAGQLSPSLPGSSHTYTEPDAVHTAEGLGILATTDPVQAGVMDGEVQAGNNVGQPAPCLPGPRHALIEPDG